MAQHCPCTNLRWAVEPAEIVLEELNENARSLRLMSDLNRNLLLLNQLYWQPDVK